MYGVFVMSSADIQAKIKAGLAKAVDKVGSGAADKVYLLQEVNSGGNTPINPPVISTTEVLLVNAIFTAYDKSIIGGSIIKGDRALICDNTVEIKTGNKIKQGLATYIVINAGEVAPTSDRLLYKLQVREQ